jgi:hypothetical protein
MKTNTLLLCFILISGFAFAQDEKKEVITRPADIKVSEYDNFKNTSFDTYDQSTKLKDNLTVIDKDVKNYAGAWKSVLTPKLTDDLKALLAIKNSGEALQSEIAGLDNQAKDLLSNAKKAGLKAPAATKNTNNSVSILNKSKENLTYILDLTQTDLKLIKDELKARGEPVE